MTRIFHRPGRLILAAVLLVLFSVAAGASAQEKEKAPKAITWVGYNEAMSEARDFDKPVFIHFTAQWCKWCKKMQKETYVDPGVIEFMAENFAAVMVDTEKIPSLARKYDVESLPTLWFLDSNGRALTKIEGYVGAEKLLRVLEYVRAKAYEEMSYDTWVRKRPTR